MVKNIFFYLLHLSKLVSIVKSAFQTLQLKLKLQKVYYSLSHKANKTQKTHPHRRN